ncbi:hypothetical protein G7Y89_g7766 [Cudoniella acicularis]|uniref:Peroxin 20 n=1 Tax=Cudoniella acicularis TaxID=354080 RepID=A0A8H4W1N1_9HELO|nr:hypothetical protein G7Y89_g7766 [Cudoniella acicularis]
MADSISAPSNGVLEPEFQAFQAGQLSLEPHHSLSPQPFSHAPQPLYQPGPAAWASDFQRLNISSPPPQIHQPFSPQRQEDNAWHQEFARQQNFMAERSMQASSSQAGSSYQPFHMAGMMGTQYNTAGFASPQAQAPIAQQAQPEAFDEEAFAKAFEEAARQEEVVAQQGMETGLNTEITEDQRSMLSEVEDFMHNESHLPTGESLEISNLANQERIGADQIHDPALETGQNEQEDPDALSRTAGQLLESVRHDQSDKFQKSTFLELMRQLRDREVLVEGDKIVGAGGPGIGTDMEGDAERAVENVKVASTPPPLAEQAEV